MSKPNNVFVMEAKDYVRDNDIVGNAVEQSVKYLQLQTGKNYEVCKEFVLNSIGPGGKRELKPVEIQGLRRKENGDRGKTVVTIDKLLGMVNKTKSILAPNMCVYDNTEVQVSVLSGKISVNKKERGVIKKTGMEANQTGNTDLALACSGKEYKIKLLNNSISGSQTNPHNPFYNKSAHSSLTSNTRTMTSYSNACTERFLAGNRHYLTAQLVTDNILSIITNTDFTLLQKVMVRYNIKTPTAQEALAVIQWSTDFYWKNDSHMLELSNLLEKLSDLELAAFVYTGDLWHLKELNKELVREIFDSFLNVEYLDYTQEELIVAESNAHIGVTTLAGILCSEILKGTTLKDLKKNNPDSYIKYLKTIKHIENTSIKYSDLFNVFYVNYNLPLSIYNFPQSIRRAVPGSDTDSTLYTTQLWVEEYFGELKFGSLPNKVAEIAAYLNNSLVAHYLAVMSKQMGVSDDLLYELEMKNEYGFAVFMVANRAKHYVTALTSREGIIFAEPQLDIKGVGLIDSKLTKKITKAVRAEFEFISNTILSNELVPVHDVMIRISNLEHIINESLTLGKLEYLSRANISGKEAYKNPMTSVYYHYDLWINCFEQKWGSLGATPYGAVKISTSIDKAPAFKRWRETLDPAIKSSLEEWLSTNKKATLGTLMLPVDVFSEGLPKHFTEIIDKKRVISGLTAPFYILLEMCGIYYKNKKSDLLLYEDVPYQPEYGLPGSVVVKIKEE